MSEHSLDVIRKIRLRLARASRRIRLAELLFGLILTLALSSGFWFMLAALEANLWMSLLLRRVAFGVWLLSSAAAAGFLIVPPALRLMGLARDDEEQTARRIGAFFPEVSDRLVNVLQLGSGRASGANGGMVDGAIQMLNRQIEPVPFEQVEDFSRPRKAAVRSAAAPAALLLFALLAPQPFTEASKRLVSLKTEFAPPAPFALHVSPGDAQLTRGERLEIAVRAEGRDVPASAVLLLQPEGVDEAEPLAMAGAGTARFTHTIEGVRTPLRYRVEADGVQSRWYDVSVLERPFIRSMALSVRPPAYTGMPTEELIPDRGDVSALLGSVVTVRAAIGGPEVASIALEFDDGSTIPMDLEDWQAVASFTISESASYRLIAVSETGVPNADPIRYQIEPLRDEPPVVDLLAPSPDETLGESLRTDLRGTILDDFGFTRLDLHFRLAESRFRAPMDRFERAPMSINLPRPIDQTFDHAWDLRTTGLDPVPGDVIEYFVEVWDNDAVSGPKAARSAIQRVRVPSLTERYDDLEQSHQQTEDELERLLDEAANVRRDFDELRDDLRSKQEADWQNRRQVEALQQRQEAIEQRVDQLTRQMSEVAREMEENNLLSEETVEMYRELTRVVEEIKSPELMDALRQLQEAMNNLDLPQMQENLRDFEFNEEQYRERLERSLELFKRARTMQQLEQAERLARELAERQEQLREAVNQLDDDASDPSDADQQDAEESPGDASEQRADEEQNDPGAQEESENADSSSTESSEPEAGRERVADEQERMGEDVERLERQLEDLSRQMQESRSAPSQQLDQMRDELRKQQLPERMRQTGQQIRGNQMQDAGRNQQDMKEQLQQLQQQLGEMRSGMSGAQLNMNMNALRRTIRDVISLSKEQEGLQAATLERGAGSPALRESARTQVRLAEGVGVVADSVQSLAKEIPQMGRDAQRHTGEALRQMGRATEALAERSSREAGTHQRASMTHLNELALMLSNLLDQLMSQQSGGSGGGGMSAEEIAEQLQQMAESQQRLNEQIQQMLNDIQGDRLSIDMQERMRQMAAEQDAIRRQLRQLGRDPAARGELMNDLDRIAEQMEETVEELMRRGASREMVERQQRILTRLLEAEQSLQEREQDERRRGRTGSEQDRRSPPELERNEELDRLRRDLMRALENDYSRDYQDLIRRYFELLQQQLREQD